MTCFIFIYNSDGNKDSGCDNSVFNNNSDDKMIAMILIAIILILL